MQEMQETWVRSLGREDPLEQEIATHSSILGWKIPWTEEPGGLDSIGLQSQTWLSNLSVHVCVRLRAHTHTHGPSSVTLNKRGENRHPCVVLNLRGRTFSFLIIYGISYSFFCEWSLWGWGNSLLFLVCWELLSWISFGFSWMVFLYKLIWLHGFSSLASR